MTSEKAPCLGHEWKGHLHLFSWSLEAAVLPQTSGDEDTLSLMQFEHISKDCKKDLLPGTKETSGIKKAMKIEYIGIGTTLFSCFIDMLSHDFAFHLLLAFLVQPAFLSKKATYHTYLLTVKISSLIK